LPITYSTFCDRDFKGLESSGRPAAEIRAPRPPRPYRVSQGVRLRDCRTRQASLEMASSADLCHCEERSKLALAKAGEAISCHHGSETCEMAHWKAMHSKKIGSGGFFS